ncbi:MAG: bifunctional proline dehydrogenase/L-glutamate gamma-semialdehyde dehydrogenase PutA [Novosphingobium sp.]
MSSPTPLDRSAIRSAYRQDEEGCVDERLRQAAPLSAIHRDAAALATRLIEGARAHRASGLDAFLHAYGLGSEEGIALMCLAEALLRVPDPATADALIYDKLAGIKWGEHLGESGSAFVNAATFSLMLTGRVLEQRRDQAGGLGGALGRAVARLGEPVIRAATAQAMKILARQFVFARAIDEALARAAPERAQGLTHSFDMLGEAAMTFADAEHYRRAYAGALDAIAAQPAGSATGVSVKLSALHPRFDALHAPAAVATLVPLVRRLATKARDGGIGFTIDAEEAERLEPSLDVIEALVADDTLFAGGWTGFGMAVQAYQKRAVPLVEWNVALARRHRRRLSIRLVKGAYWDTEIKASQVGGFADFPVFTRKLATDVSYLACAAKLLAAPDAVFPAFATHNAATIAAIKALAGDAPFEFQRLHGMGEAVYAELARIEGAARTPVRIYAPVGGHKDLLAYLVRRLLENGANSSFVNRMADAQVPVAELVRDTVAELEVLSPRRNPAIPLPRALFPGRANSAGIDLADPLVREPLLARLGALTERMWHAEPTGGVRASTGSARADESIEPQFQRSAQVELVEARAIRSPQEPDRLVGTCHDATTADLDRAALRAAAAQPGWDALGGEARARLLEYAADAFEAHSDALLSLCVREAGKTLPDAVLELREAVDFLRFYAGEARRLFAGAVDLPGPTGESNRLRLAGRGVFATITPWNFPLAIFVGPAAAALAAGNAVLAKPAEQTPLIAALAVRLCHQAGIPGGILQLLPGDGSIGAALVAHPAVAGVAFTGSTATARAINRALAARDGPIATLIAETGGQNAMIVDSSALPEQVTRDVLASAFQSAGQRCSALRVLYLQADRADEILAMIRGGMEALVIGDPADPATDVGPVIDAEAARALEDHIAAMVRAGRRAWRAKLPSSLSRGHYVAPTIVEIDSIADLDRENFGPVLHVARFAGGDLDRVIADINRVGYGLTLGLHSRIDATRAYVEAHARVGNLYVNRNQIGAVVESQPFGGEGLSGTGPKAGGPNYVARFATERVTCVDTTAAGGNAALLAGG